MLSLVKKFEPGVSLHHLTLLTVTENQQVFFSMRINLSTNSMIFFFFFFAQHVYIMIRTFNIFLKFSQDSVRK